MAELSLSGLLALPLSYSGDGKPGVQMETPRRGMATQAVREALFGIPKPAQAYLPLPTFSPKLLVSGPTRRIPQKPSPEGKKGEASQGRPWRCLPTCTFTLAQLGGGSTAPTEQAE